MTVGARYPNLRLDLGIRRAIADLPQRSEEAVGLLPGSRLPVRGHHYTRFGEIKALKTLNQFANRNQNTIDLNATLGRKLGRLLYERKWFDPEACIQKDALL